ncbi:MAG: shikimate dehydrogenase [Apibacter sp.]|uniref:Shikimate dehydrogenase n=1 Tax=Apibacter mensalis TaxID=1586267 RepID=A0A0X3ARG6_9FLAO|nr:shikimate dehydrogenase [Apibacter mensalis]MCO6563969.1 shikimate dehydrogenase [Apibacter sp.]CVK17020.1 shikimate dehydrogenase [Apibacter mensalis]
MVLGLLGKNISYSFSKNYFNEKFDLLGLKDYSYKIFDITSKNDISEIFNMPDLLGFNVTIPFKKDIIDFLDELSPEAEKIGAVNTVKIDGTKRIGYNTDAIGFKNSLVPLLKPHHQSALILGNGGAFRAVAYILQQLSIPYMVISRNGMNTYSSLNQEIISSHNLIINTTPVGTFPNINDCPPIPVHFFKPQHLIYDLIYNPEETKLLKLGKKAGSQTKNGLEMLHLQADFAWNIWYENQ